MNKIQMRLSIKFPKWRVLVVTAVFRVLVCLPESFLEKKREMIINLAARFLENGVKIKCSP